MIFNNMHTNLNIYFEIDAVNFNREKENTFLGVIDDESITWKSQISFIKTNMSKSTAVLRKVIFFYIFFMQCIAFCF